MLTLYVDGNQIGTMADADKLVSEFSSYQKEIEVRDGTGRTLGRFVPEPLCPWNPSLTRADLDRISAAGGGIPLSEFWKRMGVE